MRASYYMVWRESLNLRLENFGDSYIHSGKVRLRILYSPSYSATLWPRKSKYVFEFETHNIFKQFVSLYFIF